MPRVIKSPQLNERDRDCIAGVALGQKRTLVAAIERFHPVVYAMLAHRVRDLAAARRLTDQVVRQSFHALLTGSVAPGDFVSDLNRRVAAAVEMAGADGHAESAEALHSMHAAAKLVRRRAAARAILDLPLAQFVALVLHYHSGWSPPQMVGIVGDDESEVLESLAAAHAAVAAVSHPGE
jgi:hypothetical protein